MAEQYSIPLAEATDSQPTASSSGAPVSPILQPKASKKTASWVALCLVIALVLSNVVWGYIKVQDDQKNDSLGTDLNELTQEHNSLQNSYNDLKTSYDDLQMSHDTLETDNGYLQQRYDLLQSENQLYESLRLESTVADYYETLREDSSMQTSDWWYSWLSTQDKVDFCAGLAQHDIGKIYWPALETTYFDYYGTFSYNDARLRLSAFMTYADVQVSDNPVLKIEKILEAIVDYITYRPDMNDRYNSPWETLAYQSGDCDDFSTLAAALFELAGIDSSIEFVRNSANACHAMVLVHLENLGSYGYYYYSDLTGYGLSSGKWIVIEPQKTINDQNDSVWMSQWNTMAAAEI